MLPKQSIWNLREEGLDNQAIEDKLQLPLIIRRLLANRGLTEAREIHRFLSPSKTQFYSPYLLKDMDKAVKRIEKALEMKERISIYGDYDVDGMTSTSVLYLFLKNECHAQVSYYIPDRLTEGYGVNKEALNIIKEEGAKLLITVDTGITAYEESKFAHGIGLDMIITDHHECQEAIPEAIAVIDPKREDCDYPFKMLAGVGVAFKLIQALAEHRQDIDEEAIWKYLDIVAIGTVADIVPLVDENRLITSLAFKTIPSTWNIGLQALLKVSEYNVSNKMTAGFIGFRLAPRLNAAGRMGDAKRGVELFITEQEEKAIEIAEVLNQENLRRQTLEDQIYQEAIEQIEKNHNPKNERILVVASRNWHHGVIGIVASKITERYYRPSILLCVEEGIATGSARSVEGFSIFDALSSTKSLMKKFGGHEMAAGLSIEESKIDLLRDNLNAYAQEAMEEETLRPKLKADMVLPISEIDLPFLEKIQQLEPYGMGNPEPHFIIKGKLKQLKTIGETKKHLKLELQDEELQLDAVGFNMAYFQPFFESGQDIQALGTLTINEWNGRKKPQMMLKDIKYPDRALENVREHYKVYTICKREAYKKLSHMLSAYSASQFIKREAYESLYRTFMRYEKYGKNQISLFQLLGEKIEEKTLTLLLMLDVFTELEIMSYDLELPYLTFQLMKGKKVNLLDSRLYHLTQEV